MVRMAFLMAESSSLLRAPVRNWLGWCFITRLFRGLDVGVGPTVAVGVDGAGSGVGSRLGVVDAERILGAELAVVPAVVLDADWMGCRVGSRLGVVDAERILGAELAVVATVVLGVDWMGCAWKVNSSVPYMEMKITISQAQAINRCFSIRSGLRDNLANRSTAPPSALSDFTFKAALM